MSKANTNESAKESVHKCNKKGKASQSAWKKLQTVVFYQVSKVKILTQFPKWFRIASEWTRWISSIGRTRKAELHNGHWRKAPNSSLLSVVQGQDIDTIPQMIPDIINPLSEGSHLQTEYKRPHSTRLISNMSPIRCPWQTPKIPIKQDIDTFPKWSRTKI